MDCCNYLPYKNHYYGTQQYFEPQMPQYPPDYYANPPQYPDYYGGGGGNTPYYQSHPSWQCGAAPFSDYVYNPKEARIRKAMRDACRERTMGVAPSSRGGRRSQPWVMSESEDQFMMTPTHGMRGVVASPMCGNGFPIGNVPPNGQYMQPMHSYNKHMHLLPHETNNYMQANPMAQLQHQTEMWHQYHQSPSPMRTNQSDQFMLPPSQMPTYHHPQHQQQEMSQQQQHPPDGDKVKGAEEGGYSGPEAASSSSSGSSPHTNENVPPNRNDPAIQPDAVYERKPETNLDPATEPYGIGVYHENVLVQNPFDKAAESLKIKKLPTAKPQKSLPDFNEAFGSTERGRFQSPPDPRLPHKQGYMDYIYPNNDLKFEDYHI